MSHDSPDQPADTPRAADPAPGAAAAASADAAAAPSPEAAPAPSLTKQEPVTPAPAPADDDLDAYLVPAGTVVAAGPGLLARFGAEAFGSFVLILAGIGTALYAGGSGALGVALAFGVALLAALSAVGHVSGGHFNPAVTLGAVLAGRTSWKDLLPYWLAQLLGGAAATAVLFVVATTLPALSGQERQFFSTAANGFGTHSPIAAQAPEGFSWIGAGLIELVATAVLVGIVLGATDRRAKAPAPVAIGLALAALLLVATPVTNGSLNPARSFAAAIFAEGWAWSQMWLFWAAPLLGAAIAALVYRAFAAEPVEEDNLLEEDDLYVTTQDTLVVEEPRGA